MTTRYTDLDEMERGYLDAALWSGLDYRRMDAEEAEDAPPLDAKYDSRHFSPAAIARAIVDCAAFRALMSPEARVEAEYRQDDLGCDFSFTRNRHGCGFWDGDWPEAIGEELTRLADAFGETELYPDDGLLHFEGGRPATGVLVTYPSTPTGGA